MCYTCRKASGVAMLACSAVMVFAVSAAHGGSVCYSTQDASATVLISGAQERSESLDEMAGLEPSGLPVLASSASQDQASALFSSASALADPSGPHATVIPLPPGVWPGFAGLGSLAAASVALHLRRSR